MNLRQLASLSRNYYLRSQLGVLAGIAVATAVLVGALVVGDSVRGSLRSLALERLGDVDQVILPNQPFRAELADEIAAANGVQTAPIWVMPCSLSYDTADAKRQLNRLITFGVDDRFWQLDKEADQVDPQALPAVNQTVLAGSDIAKDKEVILRLPRFEALPADSTLGERIDTNISYRTKISQDALSSGIANFQLQASQLSPRNIFLDHSNVNSLLGFEDLQANAILVKCKNPSQKLEIQPSLKDYGLSLERIELQDSSFLQLESNSLVLSDETVETVQNAFGSQNCSEGITYLANLLEVGDRSIPYSTVSAIETPITGKELKRGEIILNRWAADDLQAKVGDVVALTYYEPESTHGKLTEAKPIELKLVGIVELQENGKPTNAADPRLAPRLEGVTDAESINNWDLPFELVHEIRQIDEDYWDEYSTTPKAFISLSQAREIWSTRWGSVSWIRIDTPLTEEEALESLAAALDPVHFGFNPRMIRNEILEASSGSTPFDVLFLMFSMFLIAASLMLIILLVRLTVDEKSKQIGLLGAFGFDRIRLRSLMLSELWPIILVGTFAGLLIGIGYAALLILALETVWIDAIASPFLELHLNPVTLLIGFSLSLLISYFTIRITISQSTKVAPRELMSHAAAFTTLGKQRRFAKRLVPPGLLLIAVLLAYLSKDLKGDSAAGAFFGVGGLVLVSLLLFLSEWLAGRRITNQSLTVVRLAFTNLARGGNRTLLTIGLTAAACFMILATSVFRLSPTYQGTGGFTLVFESDQPIYHDLNTEEGRYELGFSKKDDRQLDQWHFYPFRMESGQDASCQNLYQASRPRLLGASREFIKYGGFQWAEILSEFESNPWLALLDSESEKSIPVVLDYNTAVYAMKLYGGVGSLFSIKDEFGNELVFEIVGLLKNTMLQGVAILNEKDLVERFPSTSGYQYFLAESLTNQQGKDLIESTESLGVMLEDRLIDYGVESELSRKRLASFLSVQNTYLSTFQALGAFGVLLGAVGLMVAQYRNLNQRRAEFALMRSNGFTNARLRMMVLIENLWQLGLGLVIGAVAAMISIAPLTRLIGTSFPWSMAFALLLGILVIGRLGASLASSKVLRSSILTTLRAE